ncbi:hypothetical protein D3C83_37810 [compost metagenome]
MAWPLYERITSPTCSPAFSAGEPGSTLVTTTPFASSMPKDAASSFVRRWMPIPRRPRVTLPVSRSWREMSIATSIGMAKDTPM